MRRTASRPLASALALALTLVLLAASVFPVATGAVVPRGGAPDLIVLFTGDVEGYIEPCG
jgi:hypothetical protein